MKNLTPYTKGQMKHFLAALFTVLCCSSTLAQTLPTIDISFSGTKATVTIPSEITDVTCSSGSSSHVAITCLSTAQEYHYRVSGNTSNGSLTITSNGYKMTLEMAGANIVSTSGMALNLNCGKRVAFVLADGTTNRLEDSSGGSQKAALYCAGHLEFQGGGTLSVKGNSKHAISAKEYIELKDNVGTINVLGAVSDGIHCGRGKVGNANNYFEMKGGEVNISGVGSDCIDSDDYGCMKIKGGTLNLAVTSTSGAGLKCDSILSMRDGNVNITLSAADAEGIRCNYSANFSGGDIVIYNSGTGSKGIKVKEETTGTVLNGGNVFFTGSQVDINLSGKTLTSGGDRCMAFSVDKNMFLSAGTITVKRTNSQVKSHKVKGLLTITESGLLYIDGTHYKPITTRSENMSIYAKVNLFDESLDDYANFHIGAFVGDECRGNGQITMARDGNIYIYLPVVGQAGESVDFRLYDASDEWEWRGKDAITFTANTTKGLPSAPVALSFGTKGDVNSDGRVTISDLSALISVLNGSTSAGCDVKAADMDNNGTMDQEDAKRLENVILLIP